MWRLVSVLLLLAACSVSPDRYVRDVTEQDCAYALSCFDASLLTFYGWDSQEACEADIGPRNAALPAECAVFDKKKAKECIAALEDRASCVESDDPADLAHPAICDEVFTSCEAADTDPDGGVDTDHATDG